MTQLKIENLKGKKIYFASDFHLGAPNWETSRVREKAIVRWLSECQKDAHSIFLVGDIFDFWFEYSAVVPKGFVRLFGKLAELTDSGIQVHIFTGNHDQWIGSYLKEEVGAEIHYEDVIDIYHEKQRIHIGHGDGTGPGDALYKWLKKWAFLNPFLVWVFRWLHPNFSFWIARITSKTSRAHSGESDEKFLGEDEWLLQYCKSFPEKVDYFIFGHRHLPLDLQVKKESKYINLGEWMNYNSYAEYNGKQLILKYFEK